MEIFSEIINYIARTNLFNFVIFLSIILYLCKKLDVAGKIEAAKTNVKDVIDESSTVKSESESRLLGIEKSVSNIEEEIESILKKSEENAKMVGEKIIDDAEKSATIIQDNTEKAIENRRVILKNDLVRRASLASVEVAKSHIINELNVNPSLHDKLIDESIESIEGSQL
jgi:F0F1-type ATP synthase membrane subunit b/b'